MDGWDLNCGTGNDYFFIKSICQNIIKSFECYVTKRINALKKHFQAKNWVNSEILILESRSKAIKLIELTQAWKNKIITNCLHRKHLIFKCSSQIGKFCLWFLIEKFKIILDQTSPVWGLREVFFLQKRLFWTPSHSHWWKTIPMSDLWKMFCQKKSSQASCGWRSQKLY